MILPSAPPSRHRSPESPTLAELAPDVSFFRQVVMPLLALLLLFAAYHWGAGKGLSFESVGLRVMAAARWLHDMHVGSVAFFVVAAISCFAAYVGRVMAKLGWRDEELLLSRLPWSRIEVIGPMLQRNVQATLKSASTAVAAITLMLMAQLVFVMVALGTPGFEGTLFDSFIGALIPAGVVAFVTALVCFDLNHKIEQRAGDAQLVCPTQRDSLSAQILAAHAAGHFDTPEAQAAFEAWQLRRKPD